MITPMIKYSFLVFHRDFDKFLEKLQELGLVDISKEKRTIDEEENKILQQINRYTAALKFLETRKQKTQNNNAGNFNAEEILGTLERLQTRRETLDNLIKKAQKELAEVRPWGDFEPDMIKKLESNGLKIRFYIIPVRNLNTQLTTDYPIEIIGYESGHAYVVYIDTQETTLPADFQEIPKPIWSMRQKQIEIYNYQNEITSIENEFDNIARQSDTLKEHKLEIVNTLEYKIAGSSAEKEANDTLMILNGWVPEHKSSQINQFAEKENIICISQQADKDDNIPILLKNSRYSRLFEPISKLFSLPVYGELDLTPFFAPFFMLFFGFCFGDAGYGLLFVAGAGIIKLKAKPNIKPLLTLVQILGAAAVLFGALTGTIFGYDLSKSNIPALADFKQYFLDPDIMFRLSLGLGLFQIIFGMGVKAANQWIQRGPIHAISTISWIILIISTGVFYILAQTENPPATLFGPLHIAILVISGIGIMFFNTPDKNIFVNFGLGFWDTYNMATGILGDTLSYIRLFALGLSSGILGGVFNSLAFGLAPDIPVLKQLVIVILLVVGHSINIFMAALGSMVHPIRLIFVEFYKNAGFTGGGRPYQPFEKKRIDTQ